MVIVVTDEVVMLPGTVATRGGGSFYGYSGTVGSDVIGRGNPDITRHRFFDTMASYYELQDAVARAIADEKEQEYLATSDR